MVSIAGATNFFGRQMADFYGCQNLKLLICKDNCGLIPVTRCPEGGNFCISVEVVEGHGGLKLLRTQLIFWEEDRWDVAPDAVTHPGYAGF